MASFIGVVHRAQVHIARDAGIVAFSHGKEPLVRNLAVGDTVIYYAPKTDLHGDPVQAFVAHARITGTAPFQRDWLGDVTAWVREATFDPVAEIPVRSLLHDLSFVKNKPHWGMTFRGGRFSIPDADYRLIAKEMGLS